MGGLACCTHDGRFKLTARLIIRRATLATTTATLGFSFLGRHIDRRGSIWPGFAAHLRRGFGRDRRDGGFLHGFCSAACVTDIIVGTQFAIHEGAGLFVTPHVEQTALLRRFEQRTEGAEAIVRFIEIRLAALDRLFQHRRPDLAALTTFGKQRIEGFHRNRHRLGPTALERFLVALVIATIARLGIATWRALRRLRHQIIVEDELIAIGDQQIRRRLTHPDADHLLGVFPQLRHQRRKIRITADDHEGIDVRLGIAQVERIDDQPDVSGILAGLAHMGNFDEFKARLVHRRLEGLVAFPVTVRLLHHDAALQQQPFQHTLDVELVDAYIAHTKGNVFKIAKHRHADAVMG